MANLALDTVYNHYLTTYFHDNVTKYDTHKKSELRGIYNSIVKINKESPLFLPVKHAETKEFAVGLKEGARELRNTIASLGGIGEEDMLNKKVAFSTNRSIADATYVGDDPMADDLPEIELGVISLAQPQTNMGRFVPKEEHGLASDTYSFDVNISGLSYEFQYNVNPDDTNQSIQEKLARLINGANIGITASVETTDELSALSLKSISTGRVADREALFTVTDDRTSKRAGSVNFFGLNDITSESSNAIFTLNGIEREAGSNHFTIEKTYEITLNGVSSDEDDVTHVGMKTDSESLAENISQMVDGYNKFVDSVNSVSSDETKNDKLLSEMKSLSNYYKADMDEMGISLDDEGHMSLDGDTYRRAAENGNIMEALGQMKNFANSLVRKTEQISLNPMQYVNRTVVAYKKPGNNFATPYITSAYSGMLFNSYC